MDYTDFILDNNIDENILMEWRKAGCQHPAPPEVMEAKQLSGLTWGEFIEWIDENDDSIN